MALRSLLFVSLMAGLAAPAMAAPATDADALLRDLRQAYGGAHWNGVRGWHAEGKQTSEDLTGAWQATVNLGNGYYITRTRNDLFTTAEGFDAQGHWRQDITGLSHPLDSDEAKIVTVSENWLRGLGFLRPELPASYRVLPDAKDRKHRYLQLEATPAGGRPVTLWIDPATHRLDRAVWQSSFLTVTERYSDYRAVDGKQLPFQIHTTETTVSGASDGETDTVVSDYQMMGGGAAIDTQRPANQVTDVTMAHDALQAIAPMHLEAGVLLVDVSINGHAPAPFILDTGGHAILTTDAANKLGLRTQGQGVATGSGPGSMSTSYTKVDDLALGDAHVRDLPFSVMPFPYSFYERGEGKEPIAGILGLEVFERFAVTYDYDRGELRLQPFDHGQAPQAAEGDALTLRFTDDMPLTTAQLDGHRGMFGIDTGNGSYLLTFPQWAERNGIATRYAAGAPIPTGGVGGLFTAHIAHAHELVLGNQRLDNVVAMLTRTDAGATGNPSEAGNIGQDVLARYNVHFDYRRQQMVLMPRKDAPPKHYAMAGIRVTKQQESPDRFQVIDVIPDSPAAQAGLRKGDAIVAANGKPASVLGTNDLRAMSGWQPENTPLTLKLADGRELKMVMRDLAPR
ncbi:aspartyl protease family protein [Dyella japonica]|uniref:Signaling protein n=1 Tax=Dyella japonica A8 TaxID=1217721 RepID=A0A075JWH7_9GAMM|nr:aspartyl protease family protein [Dyella japonica]AIF45885.1 signaling protein [Dyella japonica A8]